MGKESNRPRAAWPSCALFLALSLWVGLGRAQSPNAIPVAPLPSAAPVVPLAAGPAPDLSPFGARLVSRGDVELDDDTWSNVAIPPVRSVHPGDVFSPALSRRALSDVLDTGQIGRATSELQSPEYL